VLLGTVMGVYLVKLLPSWFVLALLVVVLTYVAFKTFDKGRTLWNLEKLTAELNLVWREDGGEGRGWKGGRREGGGRAEGAWRRG
jgi:hypothetical protein